MKSIIWRSIIIILFVSCQTERPGERPEDALRAIPKIDFHTHFRYSRDHLANLFNRWNMQAVLVDVSKADGNGIERRWEPQLAHAQSRPNSFFLCTSFEGSRIDDPQFAEMIIDQLQTDIASGARMVKVWKNFGMVTQDKTGQFIQIDDERLQPIWDFLVDNNIPVLAHIAEPIQAWRPLDDPNNPHYGYYSDHPEYHAYQHPEIPSWETIIDARDRWIARNPDLTIVGAHIGSMSHDVGLVAERLEKYPNFNVETAARFGDLAGQDSDKVRDFFIKYQDRVLFGTDYANSRPQRDRTPEELIGEQDRLDRNYALRWQYTTTLDSLTIRGQGTRGLSLPTEVLKKFYYGNAARILKLEGALGDASGQ